MRRLHLGADSLHKQAGLIDIACSWPSACFARLRAEVPTISTRAEHLLRDRALGEALCDGFFGYNARDYLSFKLLLDIVLR